MSNQLRIGSRGSKLALWQSHHVAQLLEAAHGDALDVDVQVFSTRGDRIQDRPLPEIGGKGLFTEELERALHEGEIDVAVHSLKDLPTDSPSGLDVLAMPQRADPRDALVVRQDHLEAFVDSVDESDPFGVLPKGGVIGTSSLRRAAQLRRHSSELVLHDIRGNVDTRLRKLDEGGYDGILLACAGLDRLGLGDRIYRRLDGMWLGAAGQGAIAIQGRAGDQETLRWLVAIDHGPTRLEVTAERTLLHVLEGGCSLPLGVRAEEVEGGLCLSAVLLTPESDLEVRSERSGAATMDGARRLGQDLAKDLMARGGERVLARVRGHQ
ncbi:MAG: hydroxymethylbilane synthase [Deltaproteobacteria bacterium]|nr:hydroxymethylbilane synthase [Deltaproteobacteria bacterium]